MKFIPEEIAWYGMLIESKDLLNDSLVYEREQCSVDAAKLHGDSIDAAVKISQKRRDVERFLETTRIADRLNDFHMPLHQDIDANRLRHRPLCASASTLFHGPVTNLHRHRVSSVSFDVVSSGRVDAILFSFNEILEGNRETRREEDRMEVRETSTIANSEIEPKLRDARDIAMNEPSMSSAYVFKKSIQVLRGDVITCRCAMLAGNVYFTDFEIKNLQYSPFHGNDYNIRITIDNKHIIFDTYLNRKSVFYVLIIPK